MVYILTILFALLVFVSLRRENIVLGTPSSPLFNVVFFNIGILVLYHITAKPLGFYPLCFETLVVLLYGCSIFACISFFYTKRPRIKRTNLKSSKLKYVNDYPGNKLIYFAYFTVIFMLVKMMAIGVGNIIEDSENAALFGAGGLSGHILVMQVLLASHLLGRKINFKSFIAIVGIVFCLFVYNVKAWVIIPFLIGWFIRRDLLGMKINLIILLLIPIGVFVIFTVSYLIVLGWEIEHMNFIWAHFCKYIYAGIGGLNEALVQKYPVGGTPWFGLPPFLHIFLPVNLNIPDIYSYVVINDINEEWTNVFSLFGGAYLFNGLIMGTIYLFIIAYISYFLYRKRLNTTNYWFYLSYYLWSSGLILSFFGNYYTLLNIWELTAESFLIGLWYNNRCKKKRICLSIVNVPQ